MFLSLFRVLFEYAQLRVAWNVSRMCQIRVTNSGFAATWATCGIEVGVRCRESQYWSVMNECSSVTTFNLFEAAVPVAKDQWFGLVRGV